MYKPFKEALSTEWNRSHQLWGDYLALEFQN